MAESEIKVYIVTDADLSDAENLQSLIEDIQSKADSTQSSVEDIGGTVDTEGVDELNNSLDETRETINEDTNCMDEFNSSLDNVDASGVDEVGSSADETGTSIDNASSSAEELKNSLDGVDGSGLDDASNSADNLANSAGEASQNVDKISESLGLIDAAALMGIGSELQGYGAEAENFAQQMNEVNISVGQLATITGVAEPQMRSLVAHISNATFPTGEAMQYMYALQQMGVETENLGSAATNMDKINDAFGIGADRTQALVQELSVLGVDVNNLESSFNSLAYANANTVGGMENYFSFLRKFDADLKQLGYDADQTAIIIAAATHKYGGGRAALTGLSDALKEAGNDSSKLEQALGMQAGALSNATALTGEYEGQLQSLANEEAEHKSILDQVGAAWDDISLTLGDTFSPIMGLVGAFGALGGTIVQLNALAQLIQIMKDWQIVTKAVEAAQWLLNLSLWSNPYVIIAVAIIALVAALWYLYNTNEDVRNAIDGFIDTLSGLWEWITSFPSGIELMNQALAWLGEEWQKLVDFFTTGVQTIQESIQWIIDGFTWLGETITGIFEGIGSDGMGWLDIMLLVLGGPVGAIIFLIAHFEQLAPIIGNSLEMAKQFAVTKLEEIKQWFFSKIQHIADIVRDGASRIYHFFIDPITRIKEKVGEELAAVKAIVMTYIQPLMDAFNALGSAISWAFSFLGLGQRSPGKIYKAMKNELKWTTDFVENDSTGLASATARLGASASDSFSFIPSLSYPSIATKDLEINNNRMDSKLDVFIRRIEDLLSRSNNPDMPAPNVNYYHYGDIDSEEKMQEILEYIRKYLHYSNDTAGRTV